MARHTVEYNGYLLVLGDGNSQFNFIERPYSWTVYQDEAAHTARDSIAHGWHDTATGARKQAEKVVDRLNTPRKTIR